MAPIRHLVLSLIAVMALGLSACVSVLPEQRVPEGLYRIGPIAADRQLNSLVLVREPDAPHLFAGRALVAQNEDGALRLVPGVEWSERTTRMLQTALIDSFSTDAPGTALEDTSGVSGDYILYWRLADFSVVGTRAMCRMDLTLIHARFRNPVARQVVKAQSEASGLTGPERIRALSEAAEECVSKTADFLVMHAEAIELER